jgi:transcriptional regulator with XRE-family HTH domain
MDAIRVGKSLRALRHHRGWTQTRLAAASDVPRCTISAIETGRPRGVRLADLERTANALGARLDILVRWNGEALDRLIDEAHATLVDACVTLLRGFGWEVAPEVSFNVWGERGSIDILAFHRPSAVVLVVEVKSTVPDLQSMLSILDRKVRIAKTIAAARNWKPDGVAEILVVGDTRTNHRRIARYDATLSAVLPARGAAVRAWLAHPKLPPIAGLTYMPIDVHRDGRRALPRRERVREPRSRSVAAADRNAEAARHA